MGEHTLLGHCTEYPDLKTFGSDDFLRTKHTAAHRDLEDSCFVTITEYEQ